MEKKYRRVTFARNSKGPIKTSSDVAEDRQKLFVQLLAYNVQLKELQCCREEVDRDLTIETALLGAELDAAIDKLRLSNNAIDELDRALVESQQQIDECAVQMQQLNATADEKFKRYRQAFHKLKSRLECIEVNLDDDGDADSDLTAEIQEAVDKLAELLKAKQKAYDDLELKLLKEEAAFLGRREELVRQRAKVAAMNRGHKGRIAQLQDLLDRVRRDGADQLRKLRADIGVVVLSVRQGCSILEDLNAEARLFAEPSSIAVPKEPSSETDGKFRGYLKKLSGKYGGRLYDSWTKRWFVFDRLSGTLSYYHRKSDEDEPAKTTNFQGVQEVYLNRGYGKKGRQGRVFVVMTDQRILLLSAATGPEALTWVNALSGVLKKT